MYACPTCGAGLVFDPKTQKLLCLSCRNQYDPENIEKMRLDQAKEVAKQEEVKEHLYEAISYKCSHCGAELITTDETITTFCSFCRIGTMLDRKEIKKKKPDYIIPFKITKEECKQIYINKIKNSLFAPKNMIETQEVEKIRGIYMPYWVYSFEKHGDDQTKGSKYSHRSGDYVYYDDYTLSTNVDAECSGITHDATSNFYDRLSESIAPYTVKEKKDFTPAYLSGYYADNEDVDDKTYLSENEEVASNHLSKELGKEKDYHKYKAKPHISFDKKEAKLALFPVYFLATRNDRRNRISYAVINGQTGKIAADIPIDFKKFGLFSALLSGLLFLLLNLFLTISMPQLIVLSILFNILSLIILTKQNKKITAREDESDDRGVQSKNIENNNENTEEKAKGKTKKKDKKSSGTTTLIVIGIILGINLLPFIFVALAAIPNILEYIGIATIAGTIFAMIIRKILYPEKDISIYKPICGFLITLIVFCLKPASDLYYYTAALVSIGMAIISFYNIIDKLNILTTRKLPQLGSRGGDENA